MGYSLFYTSQEGEAIKQGTISVLFGCHSPIHSIMVLIAWIKLYRSLPLWWQIVCIFLHDIGHWGKDYLDNYEQKKEHWKLGARIAGKLFPDFGYMFTAGHYPPSGFSKSQLHNPDKYSWIISPTWWLMSNCIFEPKLQRRGCTKYQSARMFKEAMSENYLNGWKKLGHDIYIEQWGHYQIER